MQNIRWLAMALLVFCASPAWAADGQVSARQLAALGLSGLRGMSDSEGLKVRGMEGSVTTTRTIGVLVVSTRFYDPQTKIGGAASTTADDGSVTTNSGSTATASSTALLAQTLSGSFTVVRDGIPTLQGFVNIGGSGLTIGTGVLSIP